MIKWFKHIFHDVTTSEPTGEWKLKYISPWDIFPTRYDEYKCPCGKSDWIPPMDWFELYMDKKTMDLKMEVANAWCKLGDIDNALAVLRDKDLPHPTPTPDELGGKDE